jgi:DHA3 family macrolide efflux protein-like MFS transporter
VDAYRGLLRNRTWLLLWGGQTVSSLGDAFFDLAMSWLVFVQTGSALQSAGVYAANGLAGLVLGPLGGAFADRWDRRRTMVATDLLRSGVVGGIAVAATRGPLSPWLVYAAVFCLNGLARLFGPARFSAIPDVVARAELAASAGLFSAAANAARLIGNAVAGVLIAAAGAVWAVVVDALSFVASAVAAAAARIPPRANPQSHRDPLLRQVAAGWSVIMDHPALRILFWIGLLANAGSFIGGLVPALVRLRLHGTAATFGFVSSGSVIGTIVGGSLAGSAQRRLGLHGLMVAAMVGNAVALLGMAASTWVPLTAVLAVWCGIVGPLTSAPMTAIMQAETPAEVRGRVNGTFGPAVNAIAPLSALLGGYLADRAGPAPVFVLSSAWMACVTVVVWRSPALRAARL